jgi:predicted metal-dependent peptidase
MLLKHEISEDFPTAATDGITIKYNPNFLLSITPEERLGLLAHEVYHVAFLHMTRIGKYDPKLWNIAGDYVINILLKDNGFTLPQTDCIDPYFRGWTTEQVYEYLLENQIELPEIPFDLIPREATPEESDLVEDIVLKATQRTKLTESAGSIPNEVLRNIEDLINPKLNWTEVLYRYLDSTIKEHYSWKKPNKRYMPDWYLPSVYSESISNLTIAIDTSGSISDELLKSILTEIDFINTKIKPDRLTIIDCDNRIHNIYEIDSYQDILELKFSGCGGTNFNPVIKYCNDNNTNLLLYFTDLYGKPLYYEPDYPIIWVCYSTHEPASIGETVYASL